MTAAQDWSRTAPVAHEDTMVLDYLGALWAASDDLAPELRDQLMEAVADHIAARRVAGEDPEAVLRRLGPVDDIVATVRRGRMPPLLRLPAVPLPHPPRPPQQQVVARPYPAAGMDYAGLGLLTGGAVLLPVVAPLAGMVIVSGSGRWTVAQKLAAWILATIPVLIGTLFVLGGLASEEPGIVLLGYLGLVAGPVFAALSLLPATLRRRHT